MRDGSSAPPPNTSRVNRLDGTRVPLLGRNIDGRTFNSCGPAFRKAGNSVPKVRLAEISFRKPCYSMTGGGVDQLDVKILRLFIQGQATPPLDPNFRKSYRTIARTLDVDEHTVRSRIKRFHDTGFIQDWLCFVNPNLASARAVVAWFDVLPGVPKESLVEELTLLPGTYLVLPFIGSLIRVIFLISDERAAQQRLELLRRMAKAENVAAGWGMFPPCGVTLTEADRRILRSLSRRPRHPNTAIAKEVGLSSRTVKGRIDRLRRENAVFAFPALNPKALWGSVMASATVTYPSDRKDEIDRAMADRLDPYLWHVLHMLPLEPDDSVPCILGLMLPNPALGHEIRRWAERLAGVRSASVEIHEEVLTIYEPLEALVERQPG